MKTSPNITNITIALLKAQPKIEAASKNAKNPYFKSSYADLSSVMDACKEELNKVGIVVLQPIAKDFVETIFIHAESGEWISSKTRIISKVENDPQAYGSAITYARRYGLMAMAFLSAEDDDGNQASGKREEPKKEIPATSKQIDKIREMMKESATEESDITDYFQVEGLAQLSISQASEAIKILEKKVKQQELGV